jgi:cap2 methyltransferase
MLLGIIIAIILIILSPFLLDIYSKKDDEKKEEKEEIKEKKEGADEKNAVYEKKEGADEKNIVYEKFKDPVIDNIPSNVAYKPLDKTKTINRIHIGQRKLLLNEVYFLKEYGHLSDTVVYAGAAPGFHTPFLTRLFPKHKFILWDPANFGISETDQIEIHNEYFTDETAKQYNNVLFISDIRSGDDEHSHGEFEQQVEINNKAQMRWLKIMNAPMAMLKFRIPFTIKEDYEYYDGTIYLQPWAPVESAETRLITDGKKTKIYDPIEYENRMYYFNNITREHQKFKHNIPLDKVPGLSYNYDCNYEIWIWKHYLESDNVDKIANLMKQVNEFHPTLSLLKYVNKQNKNKNKNKKFVKK